jgi:hypothetical protein
MEGPAASQMTRRGVMEGTTIVGCFHLHRGICSLMDSRREETNLTSKFKMQGPNTIKRIMATIGPRKGRNQVLEGSQDFILFHTRVET